MKDRMRSHSVTVSMTPRQAIEAEHYLTRAAIGTESARLFSAANRISAGLIDAGWVPENIGDADDPKWVWKNETPPLSPTTEGAE